ncbi:hypothetical protein D3C87_78030 [compost metagenome]
MDIILNEKRLPAPINISVNSLREAGKLLITWDKTRNPDKQLLQDDTIIDKSSLILDVKYNVYRSTSIGGIFYKLNKEPLSLPKFEDITVGRNPNTQYFYKVSSISTFENLQNIEGELSSPVIYRISTTNKWFNKINERNMWILKNTGVLMDLYVRKTDGPRCICMDNARRQGDPDCKLCFGTTFEGGYEPMIQLYVRQKPSTQQLELTPQGYVPNSIPGAWTISDIQIKNRDFLINPEGKIFSITSSNVSHAAGFLFHQELTMKELDPLDRLYDVKRVTLYPTW